MNNSTDNRKTIRKQSGFAIMAAIFLLVILSALGLFMLNLSGTQNLTSAQDVQGARAYWAAYTGIQWAMARIITTNTCPPASASAFSVQSFALTVSCSSLNYQENGLTVNVYRITSVATAGGNVGSIGYIERSLSTTL